MARLGIHGICAVRDPCQGMNFIIIIFPAPGGGGPKKTDPPPLPLNTQVSTVNLKQSVVSENAEKPAWYRNVAPMSENAGKPAGC